MKQNKIKIWIFLTACVDFIFVFHTAYQDDLIGSIMTLLIMLGLVLIAYQTRAE